VICLIGCRWLTTALLYQCDDIFDPVLLQVVFIALRVSFFRCIMGTGPISELLLNSPPPFTAPNVPSGHGRGKARQRETLRAPAALADYQLPDPNWRWVRYGIYILKSGHCSPFVVCSKFWMVDMRGDGEVCSAQLL
jgi:hypothetical protein